MNWYKKTYRVTVQGKNGKKRLRIFTHEFIAPAGPNRHERRKAKHFAGRMNTRGQWWGCPDLKAIGGVFGDYLMRRFIAGRNMRRFPKFLEKVA
jgi:hypothetical protein